MDLTILGVVFNGAMAFGAILIVWQIFLAKGQALTTFEDSLNSEYRNIVHKIPPKALLGDSLTEVELQDNLDDFLYYVDLSNEQIFLRLNNRVRQKTWENWCDGMRSNFQKPAFKAAWQIIKTKATVDYNELRKLETKGFAGDPKKW